MAENDNNALAANEDGSDIFMGQSLDDLDDTSDNENKEEASTKQENSSETMAANEDGSDIFMGESLDSLDDESESERDNSTENVEQVEKIAQNESEDISDDSSEEVKSGFLQKIKFLSLIKLSKPLLSLSTLTKKQKILFGIVGLLVLLSLSFIVYYLYFLEEVKLQDSKIVEQNIKKKIEPINLTIINTKKLNKKLKILLEDEKNILNRKEEIRPEKPISKNEDIVKKERKNVLIQIAWLFSKPDIEFMEKIELISSEYKFCKKGKGKVLYLVVSENNSEEILKLIHKTIASDAFISDKNINTLCK